MMSIVQSLLRRIPLFRRYAALQESYTQFQLFIDGVRDYSILMLTSDGLIKTWPVAAQNMFGYKSGEIIGRSYRLLLSNRTNPASAVTELLTIAASHGRYEDTDTFLRKDGSTFWASSVLCPVFDSRGDLKGFSNIVRDMTLLKQKEDALHHALKMEAIGRLAGGVAHDFNNLITGIIGLSEDIRHQLDQADPKYEDMEEILRAANRAAALTRQLLAFARRETLSPQHSDLNDIARNLFKMLRRLIGTDIDFQLELTPQPCLVLCDPGQIEQVILNLVLNARDAVSAGGSIRVQTDVTDTSAGSPKKVTLRIQDTGTGMDEETLRHVFEPFFTTKPKGQGTGLGLSTVYGIVVQNHGEISVKSGLGKGTSFLIQFPYNDASLHPLQTLQRSSNQGSLSTVETILVVEDEDIVRKSVSRSLRKAGFRILEASNGGDAIEICRKPSDRPHLLVTDIVMPGLSGIETAKQIRALVPGVKILCMSGYADKFIDQKAVLSGEMEFIEKSFTPQMLLAKVHKILGSTKMEAVRHGSLPR